MQGIAETEGHACDVCTSRPRSSSTSIRDSAELRTAAPRLPEGLREPDREARTLFQLAAALAHTGCQHVLAFGPDCSGSPRRHVQTFAGRLSSSGHMRNTLQDLKQRVELRASGTSRSRCVDPSPQSRASWTSARSNRPGDCAGVSTGVSCSHQGGRAHAVTSDGHRSAMISSRQAICSMSAACAAATRSGIAHQILLKVGSSGKSESSSGLSSDLVVAEQDRKLDASAQTTGLASASSASMGQEFIREATGPAIRGCG